METDLVRWPGQVVWSGLGEQETEHTSLTAWKLTSQVAGQSRIVGIDRGHGLTGSAPSLTRYTRAQPSSE